MVRSWGQKGQESKQALEDSTRKTVPADVQNQLPHHNISRVKARLSQYVSRTLSTSSKKV